MGHDDRVLLILGQEPLDLLPGVTEIHEGPHQVRNEFSEADTDAGPIVGLTINKGENRYPLIGRVNIHDCCV